MFTYRDLDLISNGIAGAVVAAGVEPGHPVALLFEHDALAIAAMLGVLKAGAVYTPLDAAYPPLRQEFILRDSQSRLILTEKRYTAVAEALSRDRVPVVNAEAIDPTDVRLNARPGPDDGALIMYTSGSSGQPKGVLQTHANVLHDAWHYTYSGHFIPEDRFVLLSSMSFADSIRTIYSSLLNGATLCPFDLHDGRGSLADWLVDQCITVYRSVPTVFRHFTDQLSGAEGFPHLRLLYLGGESVLRTDVERYRRFFPPTCVLVNRLGATETLTFRMHFLDHDTPFDGPLVPVGYPVPDYDLLLVDESGQMVRTGEVGEMVVRSRYLSPGYWGQPDRTATSFRSDPQDPRVRTYRTGDLGRFQPDGCLVHLGRKDSQVKIRGHRVETAEVEAVLVGLPAIREAAVVAETRGVDQRLVAYVVARTPPGPGVGSLRRQLATRLPDYMIPSIFVVLDALPHLPNGKLSRRDLPAPSVGRPSLEVPFAAPEPGLEADIAAIWHEVLGLDVIGRDDDFLDLGGDSLGAARIVLRVRDRFALPVSVRAVWSAPTIRRMASIVADQLAVQDDRSSGGVHS
jgi:amino acid adenylation domain-containing protein